MRVLIVPNIANTKALDAARQLSQWLVSEGRDPVLLADDATASGLERHSVTPAELGVPALVVALGGDGTILKAVHRLGEADAPVLGVKFGRLGFLSGARPEKLLEAVSASLEGRARVERRATLSAEVFMEGRTVGTYRALNEVVISRGASGRVVGVDLSVGGHSIARMHADGLIVATATGSTAYALSAGGPIAAPGFRGMLVVPVAPHSLASRAMVTDEDDVIEVELFDERRADACVIVDGDVTPCRRAIERVVIKRGAHDVSLVKLEGHDFYETVSTEFFGG